MNYKDIITLERFREKQLKLYNELGCDLSKMPKKKDSTWVLDENGQVLCFMTCAVCKKDKERNIDNYVASHVTDKNIEAWFSHYKAGCESLKNGEKSPCKDCKNELMNKSRTDDPNEFLRGLGNRRNIKLDNLLKIWYSLEYTMFTSIPKKYLIPSMNHVLAPSLYKIGDVCVFDLALVHAQNKVKLEDLKQVYTEMYKHEIEHEYNNMIRSDEKYCKEIQTWFDKTPIENGVVVKSSDQKAYFRECSKLHLKTILTVMKQNHRMDDKEAKRPVGSATCADYLQVLLDHKVRCNISNIRLSIQKGLYTDVSIDRIDNEQSHNIGNLRPIAIIFQASGKRQFTRKQFLHMCLVQNAHHLTLGSKRRITKEHDELNQDCPFCEIDKLNS